MSSFKQDLKQYIRFIKRPHFGQRLAPRRGSGWWSDFYVHTPLLLLFKWLGFLWLLNIFIFAPIVVAVAGHMDATHRLDINIPYLIPLAALWAPIAEELLFRFGLRRPKLALFYVPAMLAVFLMGRGWLSIAIVVVLLALFFVFDILRQTNEQYALPFKWRRIYHRFFPWIFHISVFLFAAMHIFNFKFTEGYQIFLLPLLILPQWLTGSVVAWMRVRDSFACAVLMHALFNGIPVILAWSIVRMFPIEAMALL